jgi:hypothetical protein
MELTVHRYQITGANWDEPFDQASYESIIKEMNLLPFQEQETENMYGFASCAHLNNAIYGLFIQKHPQILTDYDPKTKVEIKQTLVDSGQYLFIINPNNREIYFQHKRSADLPTTSQILQRFVDILRLVFSKTNKYIFTDLTPIKEEIDREKIVNIFYKESDEVLEMEFTDFDAELINSEKTKRDGKRQLYFNPKEEYQEGMEEAAIILATNAERASIKAKQGSNLKKDPITRAMLEGSRSPTKIVYKRESTVYTDYSITKDREILTIESTDMIASIESIIERLSNKGETRPKNEMDKDKDKGRLRLFDF